MLIEHISVSRYGVFQQCKERYRLQYHLKVPPPGEEPFYFTYGGIVHKIAEDYVAAGGKRLLSEVTDDILGGRVPIEKGKGPGESDKFAPVIPPEYKKRLPGHLSAIKKITEKLGFDGYLEWPFLYDLDAPNKKNVKGFIDRLIIKDGEAWILDYKTTKKGPFRKTKETIKYDLQLRTYARVVWKEFGIPPDKIKGALFYLEGSDLIPTGFTEKSLLSAEQELRDAYDQIVALPPEAAYGTVSWQCSRCEYRKMCKYYSLTGDGVQ